MSTARRRLISMAPRWKSRRRRRRDWCISFVHVLALPMAEACRGKRLLQRYTSVLAIGHLFAAPITKQQSSCWDYRGSLVRGTTTVLCLVGRSEQENCSFCCSLRTRRRMSVTARPALHRNSCEHPDSSNSCREDLLSEAAAVAARGAGCSPIYICSHAVSGSIAWHAIAVAR